MLRNIFSFVSVAIVVSVFSLNAQSINLQGVVSNSAGKPVPQVVVLLVNQNLRDTTDTEGKFSFITTYVRKNSGFLPKSNEISLKNNILQFKLHTKSPIKVEFFDVKGNLIKQEININAEAGVYRLDLLKKLNSAKFFIIRAAIGNSSTSFRYLNLKAEEALAQITSNKTSISGSSSLSLAADAVLDTLRVTAEGYFPTSVPLTSLNNQNLKITLELAKKTQWPTADPTALGPFEVTADKDVGPLAGIANDPIYGEQKRFNVYRPKNLATSGYLHPILIWANGYKDNPEPNPPKCVIDRVNQWCGQYKPILEHLASHGFVVVASLSTATGSGDPLPTIVGMEWIIKENENPSSPYYHCLDTSRIGQLGHSFGGMSTCMSASNPHYKALATICGTTTINGLHTPILFYCGSKDQTVKCESVRNTFSTVKNQPAILIEEFASDHGWWVYQGPKGVSLSAAAAWFRVHLMGDTANRKYFYGSNCLFCSDSRVKVEQNSLMLQ